MANYQPTYLGEIELSEETLAHYGVKGMRWRRRKGNLKKTTHDKSQIKNRLAKTGMPLYEQRDLRVAVQTGGGTSNLNNKSYRDKMNRGAKTRTDRRSGRLATINPWGWDGEDLPNASKRRSRRPGTRTRSNRRYVKDWD